jgi:hypothetical protein
MYRLLYKGLKEIEINPSKEGNYYKAELKNEKK